jgi:Zn-finger nucleic acid-binding protein
MSKDYKIFVSCDKAAHTCDKSQYNEASLWEKIKLNIHLIYCKACRKYSSNNGKLTKLIHKSEVEYLKASEKEKLKVNLNNELKNNQ